MLKKSLLFSTKVTFGGIQTSLYVLGGGGCLFHPTPTGVFLGLIFQILPFLELMEEKHQIINYHNVYSFLLPYFLVAYTFLFKSLVNFLQINLLY